MDKFIAPPAGLRIVMGEKCGESPPQPPPAPARQPRTTAAALTATCGAARRRTTCASRRRRRRAGSPPVGEQLAHDYSSEPRLLDSHTRAMATLGLFIGEGGDY